MQGFLLRTIWRVRTLRDALGRDVSDWLLLHSSDVSDVSDVPDVPDALPAQVPGFAVRREIIFGTGIWVVGDHRNTPLQQGALASGRRCAEAILAKNI